MASSMSSSSTKSPNVSLMSSGSVDVVDPLNGRESASKQRRVSNLLLAHGWLTKRGHKRKNWKRRYVQVGSNGILSYHVSPETRQKGQVNLANASIETVPEETLGRKNVFKVKGLGTTNHDELILQADNEVERDQWIEKLDGWSRSLLYKEGTLLKKLQFRNWKPRKCVINGGILRYFDEGGDQKGEITLRNFHVELCEIDEGKKKKKQGGSKEKEFCIKLNSKVKKAKVYTFKGISHEETNDWYKMFSKAAGENPPERDQESPAQDQEERAFYEQKNGDASFSSTGGATRGDTPPMSVSELGFAATDKEPVSAAPVSPGEEDVVDSDRTNDGSPTPKTSEERHEFQEINGRNSDTSNGGHSPPGANGEFSTADAGPENELQSAGKEGVSLGIRGKGKGSVEQDKSAKPDVNGTDAATRVSRNGHQASHRTSHEESNGSSTASTLNHSTAATTEHPEVEKPEVKSTHTGSGLPRNEGPATSRNVSGDSSHMVSESHGGHHSSQGDAYGESSEKNDELKRELDDINMDEFTHAAPARKAMGQHQPRDWNGSREPVREHQEHATLSSAPAPEKGAMHVPAGELQSVSTVEQEQGQKEQSQQEERPKDRPATEVQGGNEKRDDESNAPHAPEMHESGPQREVGTSAANHRIGTETEERGTGAHKNGNTKEEEDFVISGNRSSFQHPKSDTDVKDSENSASTFEAPLATRENKGGASRKSLRIGGRRRSVPSQPDTSWIRRGTIEEGRQGVDSASNVSASRSNSSNVPRSGVSTVVREAPYMHSRTNTPPATARGKSGDMKDHRGMRIDDADNADRNGQARTTASNDTAPVSVTPSKGTSDFVPGETAEENGVERSSAREDLNNKGAYSPNATGSALNGNASATVHPNQGHPVYNAKQHNPPETGSSVAHSSEYKNAPKTPLNASSTTHPTASAAQQRNSPQTGASQRHSSEYLNVPEKPPNAASVQSNDEGPLISAAQHHNGPESDYKNTREMPPNPDRSTNENAARSSADAADGEAEADLSDVTGVAGSHGAISESNDEHNTGEDGRIQSFEYRSPASYGAGGQPVDRSERDWSLQSDGESICTSATLAAQECLEEDAMFAIYRQMSDTGSNGDSNARQWELPEDHPIREQMRQKVADFIQRKAVKGTVNARQSESVQKRLPAFSAVIEQILYNEAGSSSQEEYASEQTLDMRLRRALKQYKRLQKAQRSQIALRPSQSRGDSPMTPVSRPSEIPQEKPRRSSDEPNACHTEGNRWGGQIHPWHAIDSGVNIQHYPAEDCDSIHVKLVLTKRPSAPPDLPALNKWQKRQCAICGATQTTGMFGRPAIYCNYLELLVCKPDFGDSMRPLPWRMVQKLDVRKFKVCKAAAAFLDSVWNVPLVSFPQMAKKVYQKNAKLMELTQVRRDLVNAKARMLKRFDDTQCTDPSEAERRQTTLTEGCRLLSDRLCYPRCEKSQFVCFEQVQYLADSEDLLALRDVPAAARGELTLLCRDTVTCLESFINSKSM
eukprot:gb/GECG01015358.1/.p1 GENE.gb/GECG01015358.1/~~gb/GECG01015358.1/.p1  ORF type:complete len:1503 (+),score=260.74 gb/GECG01015358.1/:1-4509(+)